MSIITILLFFIYCWGLGYTVTRWSKREDTGLDNFLISVMIGFGTFPLLLALLNLIQFPFGLRVLIDWKVIFVLSLIFPVYDLVTHYKKMKVPKFAITITKRRVAHVILLVLFAWTLYMYTTGSFAYSWLEDSDPWKHAASAGYISSERTLFQVRESRFASYFDPYPATYDAMIGILHQTSSSLNWTIKFFNAFFVSLCVIFIYYLAREMFHDTNKAIFAAFVYAMIPGTLSHFIWSHVLVPAILIIGLYAIEKYFKDRSWLIPAIVVTSGFMLTTPTGGLCISAILFLYWCGRTITYKKNYKKIHWKALGVIFLSAILALSWWGIVFYRYGGIAQAWREGTSGQTYAEQQLGNATAKQLPFLTNVYINLKGFFPPGGGSGSRVYTAQDFFFSTSDNVINNPVGIGFVICLLVIVGFIYLIYELVMFFVKDKQEHHTYALFLVILFTFIGMNTLTFHLPIGLFPFRFWMLFAVAAALVAAEGFGLIVKLTKKVPYSLLIIVIILVPSIYFTSGYQKYEINTGVWAPSFGFERSVDIQDDLDAYQWLLTLPSGTKVFGSKQASYRMFAYDKVFCLWCKQDVMFRDTYLNQTPQDLYQFMKDRGYDYFLFDISAIQPMGPLTPDQANVYLKALGDSRLFVPVHQAKMVVIVKPI
jgi:hypothetical protein